MRHIWETLLDWQVWLHILIYMSIIAPRKRIPTFRLLVAEGWPMRSVYGISLFLP